MGSALSSNITSRETLLISGLVRLSLVFSLPYSTLSICTRAIVHLKCTLVLSCLSPPAKSSPKGWDSLLYAPELVRPQ